MGCTRFGEVKSQSLGLVLYPVADSPPRRSHPQNLIFCSEVLCVHASLILIYFGEVGLTFPQRMCFTLLFWQGFFDERMPDRAECWRCLRILRFVPSLQPNTVAVFRNQA